jgi:triosephosphate isomerase
MFKTPLVIINFKTYKQATGKNALKIAMMLKSVSRKFKGTIAVAPQFTDIMEVSKKTGLPTLAQHIDLIDYGPNTGHILAQSVKEAGASGVLINHSEKPLEMSDIKKTIQLAKENRLRSIVCVPTIEKAKRVAWFSPDYIAFEVPELISTLRGVSKVMPRSVKNFVEVVQRVDSNIVPLCGAGIASSKDIQAALDLGTKGVIISKAAVISKNLEKLILGK